MSLDELNNIRSKAEMIVCGYAFSRMDDCNIRILHLKSPFHALVLSQTGDVLETTMDDVEVDIVKGYWLKNHKYMEKKYA